MKSPPPKKKTTATQSSEASLQSAYLPHTEVNESNYLSIELNDVTGALGNVQHSFDSVAAKNLIRYFHYTLKDGSLFNSVRLNPKEKAFVDYVEYAFARVVDQGKSFDVAFGLAQGRGEYQRNTTTERDVIAAAYMTLLMRNHWKWEDAKGEVANFLFPDGKGEKAVEKAYSDFKNEFALLTEKTLREFLPDNTPQIKARSA